MELFQVFGVSSLGVWLGDREGEVGWGIDELGSGDEEFGCPNAVTLLIGKNLFVSVDELVKSARSKVSAWDCLKSNFIKFNFNFGFQDEKPG